MEEKKTERRNNKGAWLIQVGSKVILETAEVRALRLAMQLNGRATFLEWGKEHDLGKDSGMKNVPADRPRTGTPDDF